MILNNVRVKCKIGDKEYSFKSKAEARFAHFLEWLKNNGNIESWLYEPTMFFFPEKRGCISYKPDFVAHTDEKGLRMEAWYEVKGYMDKKSATKIRRFRKYYPSLSLTVIDSNWFKRNSAKLKKLVPGWV